MNSFLSRIRLFGALLPLVFCGGAEAAYPPGVPDVTFGNNRRGFQTLDFSSTDTLGGLTAQRDGKILLAAISSGYLANATGAKLSVARYHANGALDLNFGQGGRVFIDDFHQAGGVVELNNGRILIAGNHAHYASDGRFVSEAMLARLTADGRLDASFGAGGMVKIDGGVPYSFIPRSLKVRTDGKIMVACSAIDNLAYALACYHPDGRPDSTFGNAGIVLGPLRLLPLEATSSDPMKLREDGGILLACQGHGQEQSRSKAALVCLKPDGSWDLDFRKADFVIAEEGTASKEIALQSDGKILVLITDHASGGVSLLRLNSDGQPDPEFQGAVIRFDGGGVLANHSASLALRPDGRILVSGVTEEPGRGFRQVLVRFNADGSRDTGFGQKGVKVMDEEPFHDTGRIMSQSDGKILLAGDRHVGFGDSGITLLRLSADGSRDATFGGGGNVLTFFGQWTHGNPSVALQREGRVVAAYSSVSGNVTELNLARYTAKGRPDQTFGRNGWLAAAEGVTLGQGKALAVQDDDKIAVAGSFAGNDGGNDFTLLRRLADGDADPSFAGAGRVDIDFGGDDRAYSLALQPDGRLVSAGTSTREGQTVFALGRCLADGSLDMSFGVNGIVFVSFEGPVEGGAVAVRNDGRINGAGTVRREEGGADIALFRLKANGGPDETFGDGGKTVIAVGAGDDTAAAVALGEDGKIVVAGSAETASGTGLILIRCHADGRLDETFGDGGKVIRQIGQGSGGALGLEIQPDGKIVVTGHTENEIGGPAMVLARFAASGEPDVEFGTGGVALQTGYRSFAAGVTLQPDGKIVAAGITKEESGHTRPALLRYTGAVTLDARESWRQKWFGSPENAGVGAEDADFDGDGLSNLEEWACGLDPTNGGDNQPFSFSYVPGGLPQGEFTYRRSVEAFEEWVIFEVQESRDLVSWKRTIDSHGHIASDDGVIQWVRVPVQIFNTGPENRKPRFFRLKITHSSR